MRTGATIAMRCAAVFMAAAAITLTAATVLAAQAGVSAAGATGPAPSATDTTAASAGATSTSGAASRGIFVPKPKGAGESLDDTADAQQPAERTDVVTTLRGDRLFGNVVGIGPRGALRLASPEFEGEVLLAAAELDLVTLRGAEQTDGPCEVLMAGGDRVVGSIVAIDDGAVTIETQAAGRLRIAAGTVRLVNLRRPTVLVASAFAAGKMEPWADGGRGGWVVADGALVCKSRLNGRVDFASPIYAEVAKQEALTIVAKVETIGASDSRQGQFSYDLVLFADTSAGSGRLRTYGQASVFASFSPTEAHPVVNSKGAVMMVGTRSYGRKLSAGVIRFAYDPAAAQARMWLDDMDLGSYTAPIPPKGSFAMFNASDPVRVESLRVLSGIVPPEDDGFAPALPPDATTVEMATHERLSVTHIALAGDQATLTTAAGVLRSPVSGIRKITYPKTAPPGPTAGLAQVRTDACRLTLRLESMTADELVGRSAALGEVRIRRAAVRDIRMNLDRK